MQRCLTFLRFDHLYASGTQTLYQLLQRLLITGDSFGGQDDGVTGVQTEGRMCLHHESIKCGTPLSLAPRSHGQHFRGR